MYFYPPRPYTREWLVSRITFWRREYWEAGCYLPADPRVYWPGSGGPDWSVLRRSRGVGCRACGAATGGTLLTYLTQQAPLASESICYTNCSIRPPLNKKLFPVHRPGLLKRADWNLFFHTFKRILFLLPPPLYSLVYKKMKLEKKKNPDLSTGTDYSHPATRKHFYTFMALYIHVIQYYCIYL